VLDDLGLAASLESLAASIPQLEVHADARPCELPAHVATAVYRIAQEALQNVVKHSGASRAKLELRSEPGIALMRVTDYGSGFDRGEVSARDIGQSGYGLRSMTERAELVGGKLEVRSNQGRGTTVSVRVPLL
jgi:signal transduction histidine kinase